MDFFFCFLLFYFISEVETLYRLEMLITFPVVLISNFNVLYVLPIEIFWNGEIPSSIHTWPRFSLHRFSLYNIWGLHNFNCLKISFWSRWYLYSFNFERSDVQQFVDNLQTHTVEPSLRYLNRTTIFFGDFNDSFSYNYNPWKKI